ncbi:MAG: hypothetical protein IKG09_00650, partial [Mycoplasmataceae bacterium]|nr:hypothetical protein [Mycoplasmataceae bacterium]
MKKVNGKNKIILLSSLSFSALASSVVVSSALETKPNINVESIPTASFNLKNQRDISNNINQLENLQNPNELFFTSNKLDPTNASVVPSTTPSDPAPTPNSKNTATAPTVDETTTNLNKWTEFKTNLEKLTTSSTLVTELIEVCDQVKKTYDLNKALEDLKKLAQSNTLIQQTLPQLEEAIIASSNSYKDMNQIPNINLVNEKLLQLSGIVEGEEIGLIKNPATFTKKDLSASTSTGNGTTQKQTTNNANNTLSIESVAGAGYKQLIKIAEIDPSQTGNYALMFEYKKEPNDFVKQGTLYIKNDKGQLQNLESSTPTTPPSTYQTSTTPSTTPTGIAKLKSSLDVFVRFNVQNGTISDDTNGSTGTGIKYPSKFENFIIQVNQENKVEILVRIQASETIENLRFATTVNLPTASNLTQPLKFGILDVQATANSTFRSLVENNGVESSNGTQQPSTRKVLVDNIESNNSIIKDIQCFSSTLSSKRLKNVSNDNDVLQDRQLEFYQGPGVNLTLPLYFAYDKTYLGSGGSFDQNAQTFSYKPLNIFVGGSDSNSQQMISINSSDTKASTIEPNFFSMDETLIEELEKNNSSKISGNFKEASKITLNSTFDSTSTFTKQTLKFSDFFYAIGQREEGWFSINRVNETNGITILDPTEKIFLEKPTDFVDAGAQSQQSETSANKTIDKRAKIVDILSSIYEQFISPNSGDFSGQKFSLGLVNLWSFSKSGNSYSNIRLTQKNISGSGHDIFNALNNNWKDLSNIMNSIFGVSTSATRYQTKDAVGNYLTNVTEFTTNSIAIETIISDSISIIGEITENTSYSSLTQEQKNELAKNLVELISLQFSTISNEFSMRQYEPIYQKFKAAIENTTQSQYQVIAAPSEIFEITTISSLGNASLITYKTDAWNNLATNKQTILYEAVYKLLSLIYYSNGASGVLDAVRLGDSIFSSSDSNKNFRSLTPYDLVTLNADSVNSKVVKVSIYNQILTFFGNPAFDMQNVINQMLRRGKTVDEVWNINLDSAFRTVINNIVSNEPRREVTTNNNIKVKSYYLDDVISGTNAIITLVARLKQLGVSTVNNSNNNQNVTNADLISKINSILNSNSQASSSELSIWSNIVNGSYDYAQYSSELSGRTGKENAQKVATTIASNEAILNARASLTSPAIVELQSILKILWWVVVALIGVGILVSSSVG